jgi:signal peptidase I
VEEISQTSSSLPEAEHGQQPPSLEPQSTEDAMTQRSPDMTAQAGAFLREFAETVVLAILIFLLIQSVWRNFRVEGSSMQPTIHDGQYLIVNRLVYRTGFPASFLRATIGRTAAGSSLLDHVFRSPRRGDIIVFVPPTSPYRDFIKRVIGLPGDKVEMRQGRVYINDQPLSEPYILPGPPANYGPIVVAQGDVFVLGDNRGGSTDSRSFGLLSESKIVGQAWFCYWPLRDWRFFLHYNLAAQLSQ